MMEALLRDDRLLIDLAQLASNLDLLLPGGLGDRVRFSGDESLSLDGALAQIARLQAMERLEDALMDIEAPGDLASIDRDEVRELLGDDAVRDLEALDDLARQARGGRLPDTRWRATRADAPWHAEDRPAGARRSVRSAAARRVRRTSGSTARVAAASARRRPSHTSSATRSTSTCAGRLSNALVREENAPAARMARGDRAVHLTARRLRGLSGPSS